MHNEKMQTIYDKIWNIKNVVTSFTDIKIIFFTQTSSSS